ncbi:HNH endonuclease family protein [Aeromicrobium yanjiei]|uniref:HNH endonuclease family protein n=1 Tax=Aeromicrobium yanjiei TaxID=2662028 RepID=UPI002E271027
MGSARRGGPVMALVAVVALVLIGTSYERDTEAPAPTPSATTPSVAEPPVARGKAASALEELTVKGRAPRTGYSREQFGRAWRDLDRNGCDQRNDVLRRDLRDITLKAGTRGCLVLTGTLTSPYSGEVVDFVRGTTTSRAVQIDHVVALSDAWQKGAQQWTPEKREQFANDVLELRATDMHTNASKGSGDAATWLPPRAAFRCGYVARQIAVKQAYGLWVTAAERDAMRRVLGRCPDQGLPRRYAVPLGGGPEIEAAGLAGPGH